MKWWHKKEIEEKFFDFYFNNFTPSEKYSPSLKRIGLSLYYYPLVKPGMSREKLERSINCDIQLTPVYDDLYFYYAAVPRYNLKIYWFNRKFKVGYEVET